MRRYSFAYTAAHDFDVCRSIMVDDYVLRMGEAKIVGREDAYIPATSKQYRQYPGLGFTVHELVLGEGRAVMRFTEHGQSKVFGNQAAWRGISLYRWNGERLTECRVEQDYYGRRSQQRSGVPDAIAAPGVDPWMSEAIAADSGAESLVRAWIEAGGITHAPLGSIDNEHCAPADRLVIDNCKATVLDLFSAGSRVAFHVLLEGAYAAGLGLADCVGRPVSLYATGLVTVREQAVVDVHIVTDRLQAERRLLAVGENI
ncbi:nuclear transport factor 2 family protein [Rhodococcus koreensis]